VKPYDNHIRILGRKTQAGWGFLGWTGLSRYVAGKGQVGEWKEETIRSPVGRGT